MVSLGNGKLIRRASIDVDEERRRAENRDASRSIIDVRIANGRNGEDMIKMVRSERCHTEWLAQNARLGGIQIGRQSK